VASWKKNESTRKTPVLKSDSPKLYLAISLAIALSLGGASPTARAAFHLWQIQEVFTNASGTVQFIEMHDNNLGETSTNGFTLSANSDGNVKTIALTTLAHPTPGSLLFATSGFGSLAGGVTPDFTFSSAPFFNPNATNISISFSGSGDSISFTGASLPKNGINSLTDTNLYAAQNLVSGTNSPMNLLGNLGSVNVPPPSGDYNGNHTVDAGDYDIWRKTLNNSVSPAGSKADGDSSGTIGPGDYTYWRARFGNAAPGSGSLAGGLVPEPATIVLQLGGLFALTWRVRKRLAARGE
jgi:serralysin